MALAVAAPAALMVKHQVRPGAQFNGHDHFHADRPGCYVDVQPFKNPQFITISDPGFNFNLAVVILCYTIAVIACFILLILVCCRQTKNSKYRRYVKILTWYCIIFAVTRGPIDIWQLKGLVEAALGFRAINQAPYETEYELLVVWATYIPLIAHPIIYLSYCSEFWKGSKVAIKTMCGCQESEEEKEAAKLDKYKEKEILEERATVSKTQVSSML